MAMLENRIEDEHMMDNKVLLFLIEPGQIDKNVAGLAANKIMAKYQRPCCILSRIDKDNSYQGSARGCDAVGITEFKDVCENTGLTLYTAG
jgi:single-stranded DNA-specific DHH superfamily exonuclease